MLGNWIARPLPICPASFWLFKLAIYKFAQSSIVSLITQSWESGPSPWYINRSIRPGKIYQLWCEHGKTKSPPKNGAAKKKKIGFVRVELTTWDGKSLVIIRLTKPSDMSSITRSIPPCLSSSINSDGWILQKEYRYLPMMLWCTRLISSDWMLYLMESRINKDKLSQECGIRRRAIEINNDILWASLATGEAGQ